LNHPRLAHLRSLDFVYAAEADYDDDVVVDEGGAAAAAIADDDGDDLGQIGGTGRLQKAAMIPSLKRKPGTPPQQQHNSRKDAHHNRQLLMKKPNGKLSPSL